MIAALRAELVKVLRRRVLVVTAAAMIVFTVGATAIILASAEPSGNPEQGRGVTSESLSQAGGGTEVFTTAVSFAGTFLFVVFVGVVAIEFTRGTFRTMLLHQPRRIRLLAGKMAALLVFAAGVLAVAEAITWAAARLLAPSQDVATGDWISVAALGQGLADYASVLVLGHWLCAARHGTGGRRALRAGRAGYWARVGRARSSTSCRTPGRLRNASSRDSCSRPSSPAARQEVSASRASLTVAAYVLVAAAIAGTIFARRDVTA